MSATAFDIPPFAQRCMAACQGSWGASFEHPFVRALADGSLEPDRFKFYQMQDARYLEAFSDAAAIISTRVVKPAEKLWFIDAARMALVVEGELHAGYGKALGYGPDDIAAIEITPNNRAYQNHMIVSASRASLAEAVAALTPCPWLYVDLGQNLLKQLGTIPDSHPYANWLRMYSSPEFNEYMQHLLGYLQRYADGVDEPTRQRAVEAFVISARYEWMFWQQAWEKQSWPV